MEVEDSTITNEDLGYETDNTVQTNGETAAADEAVEDDVTQYPMDLEVFIEQNSDATPPPLIGQRLTFVTLKMMNLMLRFVIIPSKPDLKLWLKKLW